MNNLIPETTFLNSFWKVKIFLKAQRKMLKKQIECYVNKKKKSLKMLS